MKKALRCIQRACAVALLATTGLAAQVAAVDQRAPEGDIEIVVGSSAGATPDVLMRRVAKILNDEGLVEQPVVVVNRTGGAWVVASNYVLRRGGNENLLFSLVPTIFTTPIVQGLPNTYERVTPLSYLMKIDLVVLGQPESEIDTLSELVALAGQRDRSVAIAGANVGSTDHMVTALIESAAGVKFNYVPFDGGGGVIATFLGGNVDVITLALDEAYPLLQSGKVKPLAILSEERRTEPGLRDIPTAREQGIDVVWGQDFGIVGPPDLDPAIVAWWDGVFARMVETEAWADMLSENFLRPVYTDSAGTMILMEDLYQRYLAVLRDVGLAKQ
jgi:putative tricarboxylic transport membrane protein